MLAYSKRKTVEQWIETEHERQRTASPTHPKLVDPLLAERMRLPQPQRRWPRKLTFGGPAAGFAAIGAAAIFGMVSVWMIIPAIAGLVLIGLTYVAAWSLDVPEF